MTILDLDKLRDLLISIPDDERLPLIADSDDWDKLGEALPALVLLDKADPIDRHTISRVLYETVYVMGYRRGQAEKNQ